MSLRGNPEITPHDVNFCLSKMLRDGKARVDVGPKITQKKGNLNRKLLFSIVVLLKVVVHFKLTCKIYQMVLMHLTNV